MLQPLLLCLCLYQQAPVDMLTVKLSADQVVSFARWMLILDSKQEFPFEDSGLLEISRPVDSLSFEIFDAQKKVRFLGVWADFPDQLIAIHISHDTLNLNQVVSASRMSQDAFRVPGEVLLIRSESVEERVSAQTSDWLNEQAEITVQKTNLGGGSPIMRGMSGNRILLLVDGFRLNNGTFRLGLNQYLNTVPAGNLEQIEVLSGPSGVQYGSDGLGGTIHLRSADPATQSSRGVGYLGFVSSSDGSHTHQLGGSNQLGNLFVQGHFKVNLFENLIAAEPVGEQEPTGFNSWESALNLTIKLSADNRLRLINSVSEARHVPRTDRILSGRDLLWEYHPQSLALHGLRFESHQQRALMDFFEVGVAFMRQLEGNQRISAETPSQLTQTRTSVETMQFNGSFTRMFPFAQLVYGFDVQSDSLAASGLDTHLESDVSLPRPGKFPDDASFQSYGLFLLAERELAPHLRLKLGLRQSVARLKGTVQDPIGAVSESYRQLTPSLSLSRSGNASHLSLSVSQGYRAPNLEDALSLGPSNRGFDAPNPNLQPEDVWSYEANWRLRWRTTSWQASLFTSRYDHLMERIPSSWLGSPTFEGEPVFILDNVGSARVDGFSLSFESLFGPHTFRADGSWTYGWQLDKNAPMSRVPPLRGNLAWRFKMDKFQLSTLFSGAARQHRLSPADIDDSRIPVGGTPAYAVFHVRSRFNFSAKLTMNLSVENLGDYLYKQHGSGIYEPGRRALISVDVRWR